MIKIFGVGNSFTVDAHTWLKDVCEAAGIEVKLVTPFIGGWTFKRHLDKIENNAEDYELVVNGVHTGKKTTFLDALYSDDWDIVTFNQGSVQAGRPFSYYPYINQLKELILKHSPEAKMFIYQTWGYESDAEHPYFPVYNSSQKEMHTRTRDSYKLASRLIDAPIIPVGDVIQHLRENLPEFDYKNGGMSLNRDGYHLSEIYGRYAAAITFYYSIFGGNKDNTFVPYLESHETNKEIIEKIKNIAFEIVNCEPEVDED